MRSSITLVILIGFGIVGTILASNFYLSDSRSLTETSTVTTTITDVSTLQETVTHILTEERSIIQTETITNTATVDVTRTTETSATSNTIKQIIIILPFDPENPPDGLQPMGETINHEAKYGGHPGIDFQWLNVDSPPKIYTAAKGVIVEIIQGEYWDDWSITVSHSGFDKEYFTRYSHLGSYDTNLEIGAEVDRHTFIGYALHPPNVEDPNMHAIHWEFGKMDEWGRYDIRLCPVTYFDNNSRSLLEKIWEIATYSDKDQFPHICSGFYQGMDDSEGSPRPSSDDA